MSELTGVDQAQAMLRRVSPKGRERAARERQLRRKRTVRTTGLILLAALIALACLGAADAVLGTLTAAVIATILALFVLASAAIAYAGRARPIRGDALPETPLTGLPAATAVWLEHHQAALPAPAVPLADGIAVRLQDLALQVTRLRGDEPAADSVRRLLSAELPDLLDRYHRVPARLRGETRDDGQSADAHLLNGLRIVDEEVARMTAQLASGDLDALAIQDRFLELKYQGDEMLRP